MKVVLRGHPDHRLWRWPLRRLPIAVCRICSALVLDVLGHARWHARQKQADRGTSRGSMS